MNPSTSQDPNPAPVSPVPEIVVMPTPAQPASPAPRRTRNGKIARLPYLERDMVNRMLRNNIDYGQIVDALSDRGFFVTERNISNWKTRGGYREWCSQQDRALETRILQDNLTDYLRKADASELPEVGLQLAATSLSQFFLKPETQQQLATEPDKYAPTIAMLCRLSRQLHNLQKYRDESFNSVHYKLHPARQQHENEKQIEKTRCSYSAEPRESWAEPEIPHRNFFPRLSESQTKL